MKELVLLPALVVIGVAGAFLIWFGNPESSPEAGPKFAVASLYMLLPTSGPEIVLEVVVSTIGGVSVGRIDVIAGIFSAFLLYFATTFVIYWFTMPV